MKYIRTKDGRILESEINDNRKSLGYELIPFIKEADTIEELCDCFIKIKREIGFRDFILKFGHKDLKLLKEQIKKYPNSPVYGAIHIEDKGLIYVAKMNDKGDLELL